MRSVIFSNGINGLQDGITGKPNVSFFCFRHVGESHLNREVRSRAIFCDE